eukprot:COSAG02_NODE_734_length_17948_cov_816.410163_2_plen_74_part_00
MCRCCVEGATIYTTEMPEVECTGGGAAAKADKRCIVKEVFANFTIRLSNPFTCVPMLYSTVLVEMDFNFFSFM